MNAETVVDRVRQGAPAKLDRLGSEKALVALTEAQLDRETVLDVAVRAEVRTQVTFELWTPDEPDALARETFDDAADHQRERLERVSDLALAECDLLDPGPDALHEYLRGLDGTAERVGAGLVARPLIVSRTHLQVINFFVNEGDEDAADVFRDLRSRDDDQSVEGAELLLDVCEDAEDPEAIIETAIDAGVEAIEVAYEAYATTLEEMGVDPRPVC